MHREHRFAHGDYGAMPKLAAELVAIPVDGLLVNPNSPTAERTVRGVQEAARAKGVQLPILKAGGESEFAMASIPSANCARAVWSSPLIRSSGAGAKNS